MITARKDEARGQAGSGEAAGQTASGTQYIAHPLAALIPEMLLDESADLERDIKAHGQREPIILYGDKILDGRHRYAACQKLGIEPKVKTFNGTEDEAKALVLSLNLHRRHLSFDQKQAIVVAELKRDPEQSDRALATKAKVSPTTVAKARAKAEAAGELPKVASSKGADGKTRKRPAKAPTAADDGDAARAGEHLADVAAALKQKADEQRALDEWMESIPIPKRTNETWARIGAWLQQIVAEICDPRPLPLISERQKKHFLRNAKRIIKALAAAPLYGSTKE